jgi:mannose-1-phosphate guanylyltransferase/mannose-6-phosphate isomerase
MAGIEIQPVILSGGSGTRLWPLSREAHPKPLLRLFGEHSLLQQTALRVDGPPPIVVCNEEHRFISAEQLQEIGRSPRALILEPQARNTAPALAVAALEAARGGADPVLLVMPADHLIRKPAGFRKAVRAAAAHAAKGDFVVFGVKPDRAETGYGYIRGKGAVEAFVEKPDAARARKFVASGKYSWNSGMFMLRASCWQKVLARFAPDIAGACEKAWSHAQRDGDFLRLDREAFRACRSESIDRAVAERLAGASGSPQLVVVPLDAGWSDIGSWDALWEASARDAQGNVTQGDVLLEDAGGTLVFSDGRLVAAVGTRDLMIVDTPDALLVAERGRAQDVKSVVQKLKLSSHETVRHHRTVHRPWGTFTVLEEGARFKIKRIVVKPGASLSLQLHHHRSEHWVVVAGTAKVTNADKEMLLRPDESTYIKAGTAHRLANPGAIDCVMIEVQAGDYVGEDDIVRLEDNYGRK